jgi:hypothetical protein
MKNLIYISVLMIFAAGCIGAADKQEKAPVSRTTGKLTPQQVMETTSSYIVKQVRNPIVARNNGICRIQGDGELYVLEEKGITLGRLDADDRDDAVLSCTYEQTGKRVTNRHFILLNKDSLTILTSLTSRMKVIAIAAGVLYAEISTRPEDDPGQDCEACIETLRYKVEGDSLVKIE